MDDYQHIRRNNKGVLLIQKYMTIQEYEKIEPFIDELLSKLFRVKVDIKPVVYLANRETEGDGVSFEAQISFPEIDQFLIKRVDEVITELVSEKMKRYEIKITPTLKADKET